MAASACRACPGRGRLSALRPGSRPFHTAGGCGRSAPESAWRRDDGRLYEHVVLDGRWLCELLAGDRVEDNLNPAGRMFYAISTLVCTPNALSQQMPDSPEPLGTLPGEARLREVAAAAGLTRVRRVPVDAP